MNNDTTKENDNGSHQSSSLNNEKITDVINLDASSWEIEEISPQHQPTQNFAVDKTYSNNDIANDSFDEKIDQQSQADDNTNQNGKKKKIRIILIIIFSVLIVISLGLGIWQLYLDRRNNPGVEGTDYYNDSCEDSEQENYYNPNEYYYLNEEDQAINEDSNAGEDTDTSSNEELNVEEDIDSSSNEELDAENDINESPAKEKTNSTTAKKSSKNEFLTATNADTQNLNSWLLCTSESLYYSDFSEMSANEFLETYFTSSGNGYSFLYEYYYESPPQEIEYAKTPDPQNHFKIKSKSDTDTGCYYKYKATEVEWIMKNIFGISPSRTDGFGDSRNYYYDGYYYFACITGLGGGDVKYYVKDYERLSDGRYKITINRVNTYENENMVAGTGTIIAGLKNISGKREWVFYEIDV